MGAPKRDRTHEVTETCGQSPEELVVLLKESTVHADRGSAEALLRCCAALISEGVTVPEGVGLWLAETLEYWAGGGDPRERLASPRRPRGRPLETDRTFQYGIPPSLRLAALAEVAKRVEIPKRRIASLLGETLYQGQWKRVSRAVEEWGGIPSSLDRAELVELSQGPELERLIREHSRVTAQRRKQLDQIRSFVSIP